MQFSLFSISYAGLWGQAALDLPAFLRHAKGLGFASVMLAGKRPHLSPLDFDGPALDALAGQLRGLDLRCDVVAAYTDFSAANAAEVPYLEMQLAYVESLARIARVLGAGIVRVFTAYEWPGRDPYSAWRQAAAALREACARAADLGCVLAIQNHHDVALHTDALLEFLADIGHAAARLGFDAWSPALRGEDLYEAARKAAPHAVLTTNADYVRLPRFRYRPELVNYESAGPDLVRAVPFGTGFIDFPAFFRGLRDGGFDGVAAYEMCSPVRGGGALDSLDRHARAYLEFMRAGAAPDGKV